MQIHFFCLKKVAKEWFLTNVEQIVLLKKVANIFLRMKVAELFLRNCDSKIIFAQKYGNKKAEEAKYFLLKKIAKEFSSTIYLFMFAH